MVQHCQGSILLQSRFHEMSLHIIPDPAREGTKGAKDTCHGSHEPPLTLHLDSLLVSCQHFEQESSPAWLQEVYCQLHSKYSLVPSGGTPIPLEGGDNVLCYPVQGSTGREGTGLEVPPHHSLPWTGPGLGGTPLPTPGQDHGQDSILIDRTSDRTRGYSPC